MKSPADCRLYGILDLGYVTVENAVSMTCRMLEGGVEILQLRAKTFPVETIAAVAGEVLPICRSFGVPFILNDHPELVLPTGADGVHVGQDDLSVPRVREMVGAESLIGLSTHSLPQAVAAQDVKPDYIGFGPLFATPTKPDYVPAGLEDIREVHRQVSLPVFCIGGIKLENLETVLAAGARRVVIVSGILQAADVTEYCRKCLDLLGER